MANDPKVVEQTEKWQDQTVNDKGYREGVDYSLAIKNAKDDAEVKQLQTERQHKIDDVYGGDDPYTTDTVNRKTGKSTKATNTASRVYGVDWTPQKTTAAGSQRYTDIQNATHAYNRAVAALSGAPNYGAAQYAGQASPEYQQQLLSLVESGGLSQRDANILWAKAGGTVNYADGTPAWHLSGLGYNTSLNWGNIGGELEKAAKNGDWGGVDELLNQMKLKAKAEGVEFDAVPVWYMLNQKYNGISADMTLDEMYAGNAAMNKPSGPAGGGSTGKVTVTSPTYDPYNPGSMGNYLDQWLTAAQKQQIGTIDYGTNQAILDLVRNEQDAQSQFQQQRNQIAIDEANALDNQALYSESRGDKGGIGQAQYNSIMNAAAQNRLQVSQAQTKLSTDTARQIADLRAQGEYEKADALLQLTQQYLSQLISLEQWSMEFGLSVEKFNASLQQWQAEYEMAVSDLTGYYQGAPTLAYQKQMASAGETLLAAGIMPSSSQLSAMGITADQAQSLMTAAQLRAAKGNGGGGGSKMTLATAKEHADNGIFNDDVIAAFRDNNWSDELILSKYPDYQDSMHYMQDYDVTNRLSGDKSQIYVPGMGYISFGEISKGLNSDPPLLEAVPDHANKTVAYKQA